MKGKTEEAIALAIQLSIPRHIGLECGSIILVNKIPTKIPRHPAGDTRSGGDRRG